jgi:uncharacterized membrane protein YccC
MTNLLYVGIAIGLSVLAILILWYRNRKPKSLEAGIEEFQRELRALAPGAPGAAEHRNRRSAG